MMYINVLVKNDLLNDMNFEILIITFSTNKLINLYKKCSYIHILYKRVVEYSIIYYFNLIIIIKIIESKYTIFNNMSNYTIFHDLTI